MNVIEINGFNFLEVSQSPNIIISLKGDKNFSELDPLAREEFMKKYFGVDSFEDFNQEHGTNIKGISSSEDNAFDGYISSNANCAYAIKTADCIPLILWDEEKQVLAGLHCGWKGLKEELSQKPLRIILLVHLLMHISVLIYVKHISRLKKTLLKHFPRKIRIFLNLLRSKKAKFI